jgi:hypothetical protein
VIKKILTNLKEKAASKKPDELPKRRMPSSDLFTHASLDPSLCRSDCHVSSGAASLPQTALRCSSPFQFI